MTIQWFPGHMTRARRQIEEKLKLIDVAIELLDARIPMSSRNPMVDTILKGKPRLVLLNKYDLADPAATADWIAFFKEKGLDALPIDAVSGYQVREIVPRCRTLMAHKIEAQLRKGMNPRALRALIVGIPNVGKSTLINRLAGRKVAATGDKPGVTKGQQWIKMAGGEMELLDTPGILWPKFEDPNVGYRLAAIGSIKEELLTAEDVAFYTVRFMASEYPEAFRERFGIEAIPEDLENPDHVVEVMEAIGRKRGCIVSGGRVDLGKASVTFLRELRSGKLGRVTLEKPSQWLDLTQESR
ncbi:ribosome biogenesis GTPase YlqF [Gorillibacterium sp. sgz5001074]|uniref:ribosome biogenesis GTPase YlqF n=1 Tax=Gorillibacterium sp. sgz5001074 TaxID=3446695 RepID=UPI003F6669EF